jgi:hypothetical protein
MDEQIKGQMNVDECIRVAERGLDGKGKRRPRMVNPEPRISDLDEFQQARARIALAQMKAGVIETPKLRCGKCASIAVVRGEVDNKLTCLQCGADTEIAAAHRVRRQEIRRFIYEIGRGERPLRVRR